MSERGTTDTVEFDYIGAMESETNRTATLGLLTRYIIDLLGDGEIQFRGSLTAGDICLPPRLGEFDVNGELTAVIESASRTGEIILRSKRGTTTLSRPHRMNPWEDPLTGMSANKRKHKRRR